MQNRKELALSRIEKLFKLASETKTQSRADRYIYLASKISTKLKVRIPSIFKRKFCKKCLTYLKPGTNARIRTKNRMLITSCLNCKHISRFKLKKP